MKTQTIMSKTKFVLLAFLVAFSFSCSPEDGKDGAQGPAGIDGVNGQDGPTRPSIYTESGILNTGSITATTMFQPIGPVLVITKEYDDSIIEIFFNSNCASGTFAGGASGIAFEPRINESVGNYGNAGTIGLSNSEEFISIFDVFTNLEPGIHNIQMYVKTNVGTSTNVLLDPGGWGGKIIAKETF